MSWESCSRKRKDAELIAGEKIGASARRKPVAIAARTAAHGVARAYGLWTKTHDFLGFPSFYYTRFARLKHPHLLRRYGAPLIQIIYRVHHNKELHRGALAGVR